MRTCSFDLLFQFVNKQLDLEGRLEVHDHLDRCDICRDAILQLSRDRDEALFIYRAHGVEPSVLQQPMDGAEGILGAYR